MGGVGDSRGTPTEVELEQDDESERERERERGCKRMGRWRVRWGEWTKRRRAETVESGGPCLAESAARGQGGRVVKGERGEEARSDG